MEYDKVHVMYDDLVALSDEVRLTFHSLAALAERLHRGTIDPPGRAVLEYLARRGPTTVPDIARARGVSRQHIQATVNALIDHDLVATRPNPAHRRSHLVDLTPAGRAVIDDVTERERRAIQPMAASLDPERLRRVTTVLTDVRHQLDKIEGDPS